MVALRSAGIDLDTGVAHVQQTARRISGKGWVFTQPKTSLSRRSIALSPATVQLLRRHRREPLEGRLGPLRVPGRRLRLRQRCRHSTRAHDRADLVASSGKHRCGSRPWHDLRHAHATLMLSAGVHPKAVSERLGHARLSLTPSSIRLERMRPQTVCDHSVSRDHKRPAGDKPSGLFSRSDRWWAVRDSNPRHPRCKRGALTS